MNISFVIPVYNRVRNLLCVLQSLALQTKKGFEVIIADDGSEDSLFEQLPPAYWDTLNLKYYRHQNRGYRVSLMRNQGTRLVRKDTEYVWYLDSDVVLPRWAFEKALFLLKEGGCAGKVIAGRYDWLPPMEVFPRDVEHSWDAIIGCTLRKPLDVEATAAWGGIFSANHSYNLDPRKNVDWSAEKVYPCGGAMISGNLLVPYEAWVATGGFDEQIEAQGQDNEFGRHCAALGHEMVFSDQIGGYHLYHYRNIRWMVEGVRETIKYIHEKYGLPFDPERDLPPLPEGGD